MGSGATRVKLNSFNITKYVDSASSQLFMKCTTGGKISKITLNVIKRDESDKIVMKMSYVFTEVYVDSIQWSPTGSDGGDKTMESVGFSFEKMDLTVYQTDDQKKLQTAPQAWTTIGP